MARRSALRVSSAAIARLYSTGPRTSPTGPALGSGGGARRAEEVVRRGVADQDGFGVGRRERRLGDAGQADPGALDVARLVRARRSRRRRPWRSRRPCARASRRRRPSRAADATTRISVRTSVGSMAVWNVSRKKSRAAIVALAGLAAADDRGVARDEDRRPVRGRVGVGDGAADRAPVADLRVADRGGHVVEQRVACRGRSAPRGSGGGSPGRRCSGSRPSRRCRRGRRRRAGRRAGPAGRAAA